MGTKAGWPQARFAKILMAETAQLRETSRIYGTFLVSIGIMLSDVSHLLSL